MKYILILAILFLGSISTVAQQVGDKVSFIAADGKTYTGSIQQILANQYRVRYDGTNFEAWLTAQQFTVMNAGVGDNGYKVWVKTGPCPGRFDWIAVAKENPAYGGGGGVWYIANAIFGDNGMACTRPNSSCSFSAATTEAAILRPSDKFFSYCCRQYYVWENVQTGKRTVVLGSGSPGFGWRPVERGPYCCEEAESIAGIPGACSGTIQPNVCWPGSYAVVDKQTNKTTCYCNPGLVWNSTRTACVDPQDLVKTTDCSMYPGSYAAWNPQTLRVECWCPAGKQWNDTRTACIDIKDGPQVTCWPGSYSAVNPQTNKVECYCNPGLVWNSTKTACVDPQELVKNTDCSTYPGSYAAWNAQTQRVECWCPAGKKWNDTRTACIDVTDGNGGNNNGGDNNGGNNNGGTKSCNADEQSAFSQMAGSWKSSVMLLNIGGSCNHITGNFTVIEWCDGLDWPSTKDAPRIVGNFSGSMYGKFINVHYKSPPSPHNSKGTEGNGSCSIQSDGTLQCDFGCSQKNLKR